MSEQDIKALRSRTMPSKQFSCTELGDGNKNMLKVKKEAEKEAELQQKIQELLAVVFSKDFDINHFISSQPCWSTSGGIWEANPWTQETTIRIWSNFFAISYKQNLQELRETILWIVFYVQIFFVVTPWLTGISGNGCCWNPGGSLPASCKQQTPGLSSFPVFFEIKSKSGSSFVSILCGIFLLIKATAEEVAESMVKPKKTAAKAKAKAAPVLGETPMKEGKRCQKPTPPEATPEATVSSYQKRLRSKVQDPNPQSQVAALKEVGDLILLWWNLKGLIRFDHTMSFFSFVIFWVQTFLIGQCQDASGVGSFEEKKASTNPATTDSKALPLWTDHLSLFQAWWTSWWVGRWGGWRFDGGCKKQ